MFYLIPIIMLVFTFPEAEAATLINDATSLKGKIVEPDRPRPSEAHTTPTPTPQPVKNTLRTGFAYPSKEKAIGVIVSTGFLDWQNLSPTEPSLRESVFRFFSGPSNFMSLYVYENRELTAEDGTTIPDTTCDDGACTELAAAIWTSQLTYGFGYRCENAKGACEKDFAEPSYYRQFPNSAHEELPSHILNATGENDETKIRYKVNISGGQKEGVYENELVFVSAPTY